MAVDPHALQLLPSPHLQHSLPVEQTVPELTAIHFAIVPLEHSLPVNHVVLEVPTQHSFLSEQLPSSYFLSPFELSFVDQLVVDFESSLSPHVAQLELSLIFLDFGGIHVDPPAFLQPIHEISDVPNTVSVLLCAFALWFAVGPVALILIAVVLEDALALEDGVLDIALVVGSVGHDEEAVGVLDFSILEVALKVTMVGVDGDSSAVGEPLFPAALIVDFLVLDEVGGTLLDDGIVVRFAEDCV